MTLQCVQAMFIQQVGQGVSSIVPQRIFEKDPAKFATNPIGSGAFIFESKTPGRSISFKRDPTRTPLAVGPGTSALAGGQHGTGTGAGHRAVSQGDRPVDNDVRHPARQPVRRLQGAGLAHFGQIEHR